MDPMLIKQLALASIPPGVAGVATYLLVDRWTNRAALATVLASGALALTYVLVHALMFGGLRLPPMGAAEWLPVLAGVGAAATLFLRATLRPDARGIDWLVPLFFLLAGYLTARTFIRDSWTLIESGAYLGVFTLAGWSSMLAVTRLSQRTPGPLVPGAIGISAAGIANVLVLGFYSLKLAQAAGVVCAFLVGGLLVRLFRTGGAVRGGASLVPLVLLHMLLLLGLILGDARHGVWMALLCAASLPMAGLVCLRPLSRLGERGKAIAGLILAALPLIAANVIALLLYEPPDY